MILEQAIVIITINNDHNPDYTDQERREAHQLSIEACEREKENRVNPAYVRVGQLPSETEY